ncbi:MAG: hypothetical protein QW793_04985 [Candidatus Caldarchaeum sp.]
MSVIQRAKFLRLDSRSRPRLGKGDIAAGIVSGSIFRNAPDQVTGLTASGVVGAVRFSWNPVTTTDAGKPLEALARYIFFFKYGTSPGIETITPENADGFVAVDGTRISIPINRVLVNDQYVTQYVAARVAAVDRFGRRGMLSDQVEATTLFSRVPQALDWGLVTTYDPENVQYTIVRTWPVLTVPPGYWYVVTVFPLGMVDDRPPVLDPDFGPWISNFVYGLWWADELVGGPFWPYLPPGTYHNVEVPIMHSIYSSCYATCAEEGNPNTNQPLYVFNPLASGDMKIGGRIQEATLPLPMPIFFEREVFQPVYWVIWKIPL